MTSAQWRDVCSMLDRALGVRGILRFSYMDYCVVEDS